MQKPATINLIINGVGLVLVALLIAYIFNSAFLTEHISPCKERYPTPVSFMLRTSDGLLTPMTLQARAGIPEWGLTQNAKVVAEGPAGAALEVQLAPLKEKEPGAERANGVDFRWRPTGGQTATSACLSYSVWVPEGFPFNDGGLLPGLFGGKPAISAELNPGGFGSRIKWRLDGVAEIETATTGGPYIPINQRGYALPHGRWLHLQQELLLNAPGEINGVARMWVDGALVAEAAGLELRKSADEIFLGVLADIGYVREPANPGLLRFSPFELSWQ
jgi:hypothetical protein